MGENGKNIPKRRFKEFENAEAWEQCEFEKVFSHVQNNALSRDKLNYESGYAMNVHYGDVLIKFGEYLDVKKAEIPMISDENVVAKYKASFLKNGDIIIADAAEDETVGKCCEIIGLEDERVLSGLHTIPCRPNWKFESRYLGYYMNSSSYHDQLLPLMQGTKVNSISKAALKNTYVNYPKKNEEQAKIGTFFKQLDNLITLHQRKLEKMKALKKAYLTEMFLAEGERKPKLRFAEFTDDWEQCKLADGTSKIGDGLHGTPVFKDNGDVYFINGNNLVNGKIKITDETKLVSYIEQSDDDKSLDDNTILMSINGTIGNLAWYSGEKIMLGKSAAFIKIRDFNKRYIYYFLQTSTIHEYFFNNLTGTTIKNLGLKTIREVIIDFPSIAEQIKIGQFFEELDNLITLHQRKLEKLQNIKKAYLNEMFI
ncbi:TPA: restriction endonuclease subunit S [Clostridium sporogenes]|uniref:restriction endonuclease subunit S n=1 Tax=Clostridium sporogenes TaxID=1509 RepID=UPI0013D74A08|nr:restriction endonuclease subunit S [Clostridium sporogenes]